MKRRTIRGVAALVLLFAAAAAAQMPDLREAFRLGRSTDEEAFAAFEKSYDLGSSDAIASAEIVTPFRRAVLIVREHARQGSFGFTERDLGVAMKPYANQLGFIVTARLHPLNTYQRVPNYELYVSTGADTPPLAAAKVKRDPQYMLGAPGSALIGVRLEIALPRDQVAAARAPELVVTNDRADVIWRQPLDLSHYR